MNAIDFLLNEHNKVRNMLADISSSSHREETKYKLFNQLCDDLIRHEKMEETVWYPQLKKNTNFPEIIKHLVSEEKNAEKAIAELKNSNSFEVWEKKFDRFKGDVEHHASEEEKNLFPKVKQFYEEAELEKIGKEMLNFKKEYREL